MRKIISFVFLFTAIYLLLSALCYADIPKTINYQGKLTDKQGYALDGNYNVTFRIYDAATGGNLLWQEAHSGVSVAKGLFSVLLGTITQFNLAFDKPYYLSVQVGADPEMTPRQALASAPYAFTAASIPKGVIVIWSGKVADIPSGWALCDGTNGTPDLRDKFIVGAKQDDGNIPKTNVSGSLTQSGGEAAHTLTVAEMPAHTHTETAPGTPVAAAANTSWQSLGASTTSTGSTGGGQPHNNLPPYYALAYIIKL